MEIVIVIPVYKDPDNKETISLSRCCDVLSKYNIAIVCPKNLNTNVYYKIWENHKIDFSVERFDNHFFSNIAGYNRLLLSEEFYARFAKYDYMLIYQPDAYVFEDKLYEWCEKGFDYIGAPLIGKFEDTNFHPEIMRVGNGGFSLRRIKAYLDFFGGTKNVIPTNKIAERINLKAKVYTRWLVWLLMFLGWRNKPKTFASKWKYNEDDFWSGALTNTNYELSKPSAREAMNFSFERFPKELYAITKCLPFGCHAWAKHQYDLFWKDYILENTTKKV